MKEIASFKSSKTCFQVCWAGFVSFAFFFLGSLVFATSAYTRVSVSQFPHFVALLALPSHLWTCRCPLWLPATDCKAARRAIEELERERVAAARRLLAQREAEAKKRSEAAMAQIGWKKEESTCGKIRIKLVLSSEEVS